MAVPERKPSPVSTCGQWETRNADPAPRTRTESAGPLVVECAGQRCAALWARHRSARTRPDLAATTRTTTGAVLVRTPCLGPCHLGSVVVLGHRPAGTVRARDALWLGRADDPLTAAALHGWVADPAWQQGTACPPGALVESVFRVQETGARTR